MAALTWIEYYSGLQISFSSDFGIYGGVIHLFRPAPALPIDCVVLYERTT